MTSRNIFANLQLMRILTLRRRLDPSFDKSSKLQHLSQQASKSRFGSLLSFLGHKSGAQEVPNGFLWKLRQRSDVEKKIVQTNEILEEVVAENLPETTSEGLVC